MLGRPQNGKRAAGRYADRTAERFTAVTNITYR
jgi:hypothetical protein